MLEQTRTIRLEFCVIEKEWRLIQGEMRGAVPGTWTHIFEKRQAKGVQVRHGFSYLAKGHEKSARIALSGRKSSVV